MRTTASRFRNDYNPIEVADTMARTSKSAPAVRLTVLPARRMLGMGVETTFHEDYKHNIAGQVIARFDAWREAHGFSNRILYFYNLFPADFEPSNPFKMFACIELDADMSVPEELEVMSFSEVQAAVVTHTGPISTIQKTYDYFLKRWLPTSDYRALHPWNFQRYDARFKGVQHPESQTDIFFPVTLRKEQEESLPSSVPSLNFDGGQIDVLWDHHADAIKWYTTHFKWKNDPTYDWRQDDQADEEKITMLSFGTWLKSVRTSRKLHHLFADRGGPDPHVRWCWNTKDIAEAHRQLAENGVRISDIYLGPGNRYYFDLWAWEGTRLTVCDWPELEDDSGALLTPGWVRIGVTNLDASVQWYARHVGMEFVERNEKNDAVLMRLGLEHHSGRSLWWLERLPQGASTEPVNGPARPYCVVHDPWKFESYHRYLRENGVPVSDISGNPPIHGFSWFHFYDPDGNRFNIYRY